MKSPPHAGSGVTTDAELRHRQRQHDRHEANVARVLAAMRRGARNGGRPLWWLSSGPFVPTEVAKAITTHPDVVPGNDTLFPGAPSQTWRWISEGARHA
jgi:hypothetical protein